MTDLQLVIGFGCGSIAFTLAFINAIFISISNTAEFASGLDGHIRYKPYHCFGRHYGRVSAYITRHLSEVGGREDHVSPLITDNNRD